MCPVGKQEGLLQGRYYLSYGRGGQTEQVEDAGDA
jgi:hypothetical protein